MMQHEYMVAPHRRCCCCCWWWLHQQPRHSAGHLHLASCVRDAASRSGNFGECVRPFARFPLHGRLQERCCRRWCVAQLWYKMMASCWRLGTWAKSQLQPATHVCNAVQSADSSTTYQLTERQAHHGGGEVLKLCLLAHPSIHLVLLVLVAGSVALPAGVSLAACIANTTSKEVSGCRQSSVVSIPPRPTSCVQLRLQGSPLLMDCP
jgi:hypothetical protein